MPLHVQLTVPTAQPKSRLIAQKLSRAMYVLGDPALAHEHYRQALALYTALGTPEADELRALLAAVADARGASARVIS